MIGAGIFTTTGFLMGYLGDPLFMLFLWLIGGIISFCGALAFSELGAAFPGAGGEYLFITKLFHPLPGFLSGWLSLIVGFSAPMAASAIGFAKYFLWAFPEIHMVFLANHPEIFSKILAIFIIVAFTLIHSRGIVFGSKVQNGLSVLKVVLVIGLVFAGFVVGQGSFSHFGEGQPFHFDFSGWKSAGLSLMFIMFAYSGWNSATYIGSEIKNPKRNIPRSLLISTAIVMILYLLLNLYFVYAISPAEMVGEPEIGALAAGKSFGNTAGTVISLLISFALFSSLSAFVILGPRVYYSMAREGYFFGFAARTHARFKVPVYAIILQSGIAIVLVMSGTFEQILVYMGFSLGIFPIIAVLGVFKLRASGKSVLKIPGFPYVHIVFILTNIAMLMLAFFERPGESSVAVLTALSGIPVYYWFKRNRKISE